MKEAVKLEPGNGSSGNGLNAAQKLEVIEVVDTKVEKSENRVLHAIADFKGDLDRRLDRMEQQMDKRLDRMDERLDRMDGRLGTLESSLSFIKGTMGIHVVLTVFILWMMKGLLAA